jgi:hypothetical protein
MQNSIVLQLMAQGSNGASIRTAPVKYSTGPLREGWELLRVIFMAPIYRVAALRLAGKIGKDL